MKRIIFTLLLILISINVFSQDDIILDGNTSVIGTITSDGFIGDVTGDLTGDVSGNVTSTILKLNTLTQTEIDAISPEEGMVVYNLDQNRAQIYSFDHDAEVENKSYNSMEFYSCDGAIMSFQVPINCTVSGVSFYVKRGNMPGPTHIRLTGEDGTVDDRLDSTYWESIAENSQGWHTINYNSTVSLNSNTDYEMRFWGPGFGGDMSFGVNGNGYPTGSITEVGWGMDNTCDDLLGKDFLFILHVEQQTPGAGPSQLRWINLN